MELRQLTYFVAVAEELHFGRAAQRLHISQPPLSTHVKRLEGELGVRLFDRSTRAVAMTMAGEVLYDRVRPLLRDLDEAADEARHAGQGHGGRVRVGFASSANYALLPQAVRKFRAIRPNVRLDLRPLTTAEQTEALIRGDLDVGILRDPSPNAQLRFIDALTEELVVVLPDDHRLATKTSVEPSDLIDLPMILFPFATMPGFVTTVLRAFRNEHRPPRITQEAVHQETIMGLVAASVGFSVLPASVSAMQMHGTTAVPLSPAQRSQLVIAQPATKRAPAVQTFIECLQSAEGPSAASI